MAHVNVQAKVKTSFTPYSFFRINSNNLPTPKFMSAANNSKSTNYNIFSSSCPL